MQQLLLVDLRKEQKLTQRDLAKIFRLSPGTIGNYESGKRTPPLKTAIMIAKYFNLPVERIAFCKEK